MTQQRESFAPFKADGTPLRNGILWLDGRATEAQIREGLEGNICRCTGYQNIVRAVQQGAANMTA